MHAIETTRSRQEADISSHGGEIESNLKSLSSRLTDNSSDRLTYTILRDVDRHVLILPLARDSANRQIGRFIGIPAAFCTSGLNVQDERRAGNSFAFRAAHRRQ